MRRAGVEGSFRTVGTSRLVLGTEVTRPRTLLWISSGRNDRGSIQPPASMPATFNPERASGSTATPPAAPSPITATSTGFSLMLMARAVGGLVQRLGQLAHLLVVRTHRQARSRIADQIPAGEILVAAIIRVGEHDLQRQPPHTIKECLRVGRKASGFSILHRREYRVLLIRGEIGERRPVLTARKGVYSGQPLDKAPLFRGKIVGQAKVYIISRSHFESARA